MPKNHTLNCKIAHTPLNPTSGEWGPSKLTVEMTGDRDLLMDIERTILKMSKEAE